MKKDYRNVEDAKDIIRKAVWDEMLERGVARFPLPPHGRIPNFVGSERCSDHLEKIREWRNAEIVKVNPDSPQRGLRVRALKEGKKLIMPTPRIRSGLILLDPDKIGERGIGKASTIKGAFKFGRVLKRIEDVRSLEKVDLIVEGSVAVNIQGQRIGKGEGYGDLEFAILLELGLIDKDVPIITTVHKTQVFERPLPQKPHDVSVDYIITPESILKVTGRAERPDGILAELLERRKVEEIPLLKELLKEKSTDAYRLP
ncbi:MAG: 5-formyltetrahydrofolate cyclo-ligase [Archaeoglobi archaeon]|nr:5-formyltetrahydrofolate cyclo-ligase [Archaeoglobi archaeon]